MQFCTKRCSSSCLRQPQKTVTTGYNVGEKLLNAEVLLEVLNPLMCLLHVTRPF